MSSQPSPLSSTLLSSLSDSSADPDEVILSSNMRVIKDVAKSDNLPSQEFKEQR